MAKLRSKPKQKQSVFYPGLSEFTSIKLLTARDYLPVVGSYLNVLTERGCKCPGAAFNESATSWSEVWNTATFPLYGLASKFQCVGDDISFSVLSNKDGMSVTLIVNPTGDSRTLMFYFKDSLFTPSKIMDCLRLKGSTYVKALADVSLKYRMVTSKEREERREYLRRVTGEPENVLDFMCGVSPLSSVTTDAAYYAVQKYIGDLMHLYLTLAWVSYAARNGLQLDIKDGMLSIPRETLSICQNITPVYDKLSRLPTESGDEYAPCQGWRGSADGFLSTYGKPLGEYGANALVSRAAEELLDLKAIEGISAAGSLILLEDGTFAKASNVGGEVKGKYLVTPTGCADSKTGLPLYFVLKLGVVWNFLQVATMDEFLDLATETIPSFRRPDYADIICAPDWKMVGHGVDEVINEVARDGVVNETTYSQASRIFDDLDKSSHLKSVEDVDDFLGAFTRLVAARAPRHRGPEDFNTGLVTSYHHNITLRILDMEAPRYQMRVAYLRNVSSNEPPLLPFKNRSQILAPANCKFTFSKHALEHILTERGYRMPGGISYATWPQLEKSIEYSLWNAEKRLECNPTWAQPIWFAKKDSVAYTVPLYFMGVGESMYAIIGALVVYYGEVKTLYSLDIVRQDAILFQNERPGWLR